jgi:hypothetical protein
VAFAAKRRVVINPARRNSKTRRKRNMTPKQIKFFGTPAQKAALRNSRRRKLNSSRARNTASRSRSYLPRKHRARTKNPGEILSLVLNPGGRKKGKTMAEPRRRRRSRASGRRSNRRRRSVANPHRHHHRRNRMHLNPSRRHHRRHNRRHNRRPNPGANGEGSFKNAMGQGLSFMGGYFISKYATQLVMGSANTSVAGYLGNAVATAVLAITAHIFPPTRNFSMALVAGGATQILARILSDNTAFGQITSSLGVGDYQMQNFVTPQRLVAPLESAQIEIPTGWGAPAPVVVSTQSAPGSPAASVPSHAAPSGMSSYNSAGLGRGMYSPAGLYS